MGQLISVVVPIYNVAKQLPKCLESIVGQTYADLEIILVNDGSTDNSLEICRDFAQRDSRIKIIDKQNGGLSSARNAGIKAATGEWIGFVDSDDWIESDMYETALKTALDNDVELVQWRRVFFTDTKEYPDDAKYEDGIMKITGDKILPWTFNTAYTKLYKMELFTKTGFLFPEGIALCEDFYVSYKIFDYLDHFYFLNKALYHYYVRSDSILHSVKENQVDKAIEAIKDLQEYLDSRNNKVLQISVDNEKVAMRQRYFYDFDGVRAEKWMNVFPELTDQNLQRIRNDFKKKNSELKSAQNDIKHLKNEISKLNKQVRELEEKTKVYRKERSGIKTFLYTIKHKGPKQTFKLCINKIKGHF